MAKRRTTESRPPSLAMPHRHLEAADEQQCLALALFDALWDGYRRRVHYVGVYEEVVRAAGAQFVNDHIAFRTIATQRPMSGIATLGRVFRSLGYRAAGVYQFPDKHLSSVHLQHATAGFPKLFISELELWALPAGIRRAVLRTVRGQREPPAENLLAALSSLNEQNATQRRRLLRTIVALFERLPWGVPDRRDVLAVNEASQFGAWVLVHGYNVNHFTALVNSHGVDALRDIERTSDALRAAGVPMKAEIEGAKGSKLRQTATDAVVIDVPVRSAGRRTRMPWTYAYFELAERGTVYDPQVGREVPFEGFWGPQATQLFEMTRLK